MVGWDSSRLAMVLAVLEAHAGLKLGQHDVYLNVAGGLRIAEPAADLAAAAALVSSLIGVSLPHDAVYFGEIALSGAVRAVGHAALRLKEAAKLGFARAVAPPSRKDAEGGAAEDRRGLVGRQPGGGDRRGGRRRQDRARQGDERGRLAIRPSDEAAGARRGTPNPPVRGARLGSCRPISISASSASSSISALLSMMRGFTREVLAIASWAAAAAAAYYFYPMVMPYATPYIHKEIVAQAVSAAAVFFVTLIIVSLFTVRLSDAILDSKIGALDRSLGFVFGAARGFLLAVVAFSIFNWLVADKQQPEWVKTAKTRPALIETADRIIAMLPEDAADDDRGLDQVEERRRRAAEEPPNEATAPAPAAAPTPAPTPRPAEARRRRRPSGADKQKLDALINKGVPLPAPAAPAVVPTPRKT